VLAGVDADPCQRGSVCASVSPGGDEPAAPHASCVPLFVYADETVVDVLPFSRHPEPPATADVGRAPHRRHHNATAPITGPSLPCSGGFAQASALNDTHYRLSCADPVSSTYLTNDIGQPCDPRGGDPLDLLPYVCMPGLGSGMSSALAAPWEWRSDAVALIQKLAVCAVGSADNSSATATGSCGRDSSASSPGSCAYYACFDLAAQVGCLAGGLVWDRATWNAFRGGAPACYARQTYLSEDIFACVWAAAHTADCAVLPGVGDAAGTCPYRPTHGLKAGERDGITLAVVFGAVGIIVVGVSGFALRSARARQEVERSRAWRRGGAALGVGDMDESALLSNGTGRPPSLNDDSRAPARGGAADGDFYAAAAGRR